jgi:hypothetical protein
MARDSELKRFSPVFILLGAGASVWLLPFIVPPIWHGIVWLFMFITSHYK